MAGELADSGAGRDLRAVVRYVLGVLLGCVVLLLLVGKGGELAAAWHHLAGASAGWVAAAVAAESVSLLAFAWLQHRVLRLSGTMIPLPGLFALTLANDAIANSVPGEPAVSSAYRYRYYRRRGATGASAGWTIFTILIAQAIGMSLLLLVGVVVALTGSTSTLGAGITIVGLVIVLGAGAILIRRDLVLRLAAAAVRGAQRLGRRPPGTGIDGKRAGIGGRIFNRQLHGGQQRFLAVGLRDHLIDARAALNVRSRGFLWRISGKHRRGTVVIAPCRSGRRHR